MDMITAPLLLLIQPSITVEPMTLEVESTYKKMVWPAFTIAHSPIIQQIMEEQYSRGEPVMSI